jgi:tetratricopeptide (TPR) repeat protein
MPRETPAQRFLAELRRRKVPQTAAGYGAAAFVAIEGADLVFPRIGLGEQSVTAVVWLALIGFPLAMVAAWIFRVEPEEPAEAAGAGEAGEAALEGHPGRRSTMSTNAMALGAVVVLGFVGLWALSKLRQPEPAVAGDPNVVAVLPFAVSGSGEFQYLESGLVDLLSTRMDGTGAIRAVPSRAVLGLVEQVGEGPVIPEDIVGALGAGLFVTGRVVEGGGRLSVSAALQSSGSGDILAEADIEGVEDALFEMVDALTRELLADLSGSAAGRMSQMAALTTDSLAALKAYLRGQDLLRAGQFTTALAAFVEARTIDPTFALAHYRESMAREWGSQVGATEAVVRAVEHADRLSDRDQQLVAAMAAWRQGDGETAEDIYRRVLGIWPDDVEAWLQFAEVLNHYGPMVGRPISESREAFERVLRYEPQHLLSLWHLARIASLENRQTDVALMVDQIQALSPEGDRTLELVAMRAARSGGQEWEEVLRTAEGVQDITRWFGPWNVAVYSTELDRARDLAEAMTRPDRSSEVRATGHLVIASLERARGRVAESDLALGRVEAIDPGLALMHRAYFSVLPFEDSDPVKHTALRDALLGWSPQAGCLSRHPVRNYEPGTCIRPSVRLFLLGMIEARLGMTEQALGRATEIVASAPDNALRGHALAFAVSLEAEVAIHDGDTVRAGEVFDSNPLRIFYVEALQGPLYSHAIGRYRRAQVLEALRRPAEAYPWYDAFDEMGIYDLVLHGPSQLASGRVLEGLGRLEEAAMRYRVAAEVMDGGDQPFGGWAAEAAAGAARVER